MIKTVVLVFFVTGIFGFRDVHMRSYSLCRNFSLRDVRSCHFLHLLFFSFSTYVSSHSCGSKNQKSIQVRATVTINSEDTTFSSLRAISFKKYLLSHFNQSMAFFLVEERVIDQLPFLFNDDAFPLWHEKSNAKFKSKLSIVAWATPSAAV